MKKTIGQMNDKDLAKKHFQNGNYQEAQNIYTKLIQNFLKGRSYSDFEKWSRKTIVFQDEVIVEKELSILFSNRGITYLKLGKYEKAIIDFFSSIWCIIHPNCFPWNRIFLEDEKAQYSKVRLNLVKSFYALGNRCETIEQLFRSNFFDDLVDIFKKSVTSMFTRVAEFPMFYPSLHVKGSWVQLKSTFPDKFTKFICGATYQNKIYIFGGKFYSNNIRRSIFSPK